MLRAASSEHQNEFFKVRCVNRFTTLFFNGSTLEKKRMKIKSH